MLLSYIKSCCMHASWQVVQHVELVAGYYTVSRQWFSSGRAMSLKITVGVWLLLKDKTKMEHATCWPWLQTFQRWVQGKSPLNNHAQSAPFLIPIPLGLYRACEPPRWSLLGAKSTEVSLKFGLYLCPCADAIVHACSPLSFIMPDIYNACLDWASTASLFQWGFCNCAHSPFPLSGQDYCRVQNTQVSLIYNIKVDN